MRRCPIFRFSAWLMLLALGLFFAPAAPADTISRLEYAYGYDARLRYQEGERLSVIYDGHEYFFTEDIARFEPSLPMRGDQFLSLAEYTYPDNLPAVSQGKPDFSRVICAWKVWQYLGADHRRR